MSLAKNHESNCDIAEWDEGPRFDGPEAANPARLGRTHPIREVSPEEYAEMLAAMIDYFPLVLDDEDLPMGEARRVRRTKEKVKA